MKKSLLTLIGCITLAVANAQTPVNFNVNDCATTNHDLFSELASGNVIVIAWVMPCGSCVGPTLTASNVVQSYSSSNPGQVHLYVADDAANTSCSSLNSWITNNGITADAVFSNSAVNQNDYGSPGMPKIIVLGGGSTPTVFFNANGTAAGNSTNLQNAINAALATGISDPFTSLNSIELFPNPANTSATVTINAQQENSGSVVLCDQLGREVLPIYSGQFIAGENKFEFSTAGLANGIYFVMINDAETTQTLKVVVAH